MPWIDRVLRASIPGKKHGCPTCENDVVDHPDSMKYSLRTTASHLHLAFKYGHASDSMTGRNFVLDVKGHELLLTMDLTANFHARNQASAAYAEATGLVQNHVNLKYLQCSDNLVRARMIKAWERVDSPILSLCLNLGERGYFVYRVVPHSLFVGGIQFDVLEAFDDHTDAATHRGHVPYHQAHRIHA